ncbi:MAG: hypothetical protein ACTH6F_02515, partial [Halomonas sp.]
FLAALFLFGLADGCLSGMSQMVGKWSWCFIACSNSKGKSIRLKLSMKQNGFCGKYFQKNKRQHEGCLTMGGLKQWAA